MLKSLLKRYLSLMMATLLLLGILPITAFAAVTKGNGEGTLVEGLLDFSYQWNLAGTGTLSTRLTVDGPDDECKGSVTAVPSNSGGTITMTARSSAQYVKEETCDSTTYLAAQMEMVVTIRNRSGSPIKLTALSNTEPSASATKEQGDVLGIGESFTVTIVAKPGDDKTQSVTVSNELTVEVETLSQVGLTAIPSEYVGYTVTAGNKVLTVEKNSSIAQAVEFDVGTHVKLELSDPIPEGYKLYGWRRGAGGIIQDAEFDLQGTAEIYPFILPDGSDLVSDISGTFQVGAKYYRYWEDAMYAAVTGAEKIVNLATDYTLPNTIVDNALIPGGTGEYVKPMADGGVEYVVPNGVTLLIPFDDAGTCYTTEPGLLAATYITPTMFRKLTVSNGVNITVNGGISVSAKLNAAGGGDNAKSSTSGPYGLLEMSSGSAMEVNGSLYAYGYITGSGVITANPGAEVHEVFELREFRGGSAMLAMNRNTQKVFPSSQYYVQNIEAPLTVISGASLISHAAVYMSKATFPSAITMIGKDEGLFQVKTGSITKRYLPAEDRCQIDIDGDVTITSVALTVKQFGMSVEFNSADYVLPINGHFDINLNSGTTTASEDTELLPGTKLRIADGAVFKIASGKKLYIYDANEWTQMDYVCVRKMAASAYSPTRTYTRSVDDLTDVVIDVNGTILAEGSIYTTNGGANITSSEGSGKVKFITATDQSAKLYQVTQSDSSISYHEIGITSAKLHNGERYTGTSYEYTETASAGAETTYSYCTKCDKWYTGERHSHAARIVNGDKAGKYETLTEALEFYNAGTKAEGAANDSNLPYIQMENNTTEAGLTINEPVYLDLNGKTVTLTGADGAAGTLTIAQGGALYGMDSSTNDYTDAGHGRIVGTVADNTAGGNGLPTAHETYRMADGSRLRYLTEQAEDGLSFHRYNMSVTKYEFHFRPSGQCDMDFGATFRGSPTVVALLEDLGFRVKKTGTDEESEGWWTDSNGNTPPKDLTNGYILRGTLINIGSNKPSEFTQYYDIYALLKFSDGTEVTSVPRNLNYLWALKQYYNGPDATEEEKAVIDRFLDANGLKDEWDSIL